MHEQTRDNRHTETDVDVTDELALATGRAEELERELELLRAAMNTRNIIGQAQGLLMERYGVDSDEAFAMLVRLSQRSHVKLRDVATHLVQASNEARSSRRSRGRHE